ncbi:hypothetical protein DICSQDRAFT_137347 [Dichomitus squalens LYAD-421 SS1]|uniref:Uncharacterized protein n=1 Tax=Dichomitus squalens (strain LYAD-421) TaxID=732165 RepID=R7SZV9_DICSQ|nr:uncharacterized protein DICSQDRAFT_137347 [Dichomitus squalens LYAD-421 SS1]EJF60512.1 hypothetical protein DICSQDRAFT_137347 [Dichomitus squalens LYAD-421 SS1]
MSHGLSSHSAPFPAIIHRRSWSIGMRVFLFFDTIGTAFTMSSLRSQGIYQGRYKDVFREVDGNFEILRILTLARHIQRTLASARAAGGHEERPGNRGAGQGEVGAMKSTTAAERGIRETQRRAGACSDRLEETSYVLARKGITRSSA